MNKDVRDDETNLIQSTLNGEQLNQMQSLKSEDESNYLQQDSNPFTDPMYREPTQEVAQSDQLAYDDEVLLSTLKSDLLKSALKDEERKSEDKGELK